MWRWDKKRKARKEAIWVHADSLFCCSGIKREKPDKKQAISKATSKESSKTASEATSKEISKAIKKSGRQNNLRKATRKAVRKAINKAKKSAMQSAKRLVIGGFAYQKGAAGLCLN